MGKNRKSKDLGVIFSNKITRCLRAGMCIILQSLSVRKNCTVSSRNLVNEMKRSYSSFVAEFDRLMAFLESVRREDELVNLVLSGTGEKNDPAVEKAREIANNFTNRNARKTFVFSLTIIILCGALEQFVKRSVGEFIQIIQRFCNNFDDLPDAIKDKHSGLSIDYLRHLKGNKVNNVENDEVMEAIQFLNSCIQGGSNFELNASAFTFGPSNMKITRIHEILSNIGVALNLEQLVRTPSFWFGYKSLYSAEPLGNSEATIKSYFLKVDELISLRNKIAHGDIDPVPIEDLELLKERASDLRNFVGAVSDILEAHFIKLFCINRLSMPLNTPIEVYNNSIVCTELESGLLSCGDFIALQRNEGDVRFGKIESIEINGQEVPSVTGKPDLLIGFKVGFHATRNGKYWVLPSKVNDFIRNSSFQFYNT